MPPADTWAKRPRRTFPLSGDGERPVDDDVDLRGAGRHRQADLLQPGLQRCLACWETGGHCGDGARFSAPFRSAPAGVTEARLTWGHGEAGVGRFQRFDGVGHTRRVHAHGCRGNSWHTHTHKQGRSDTVMSWSVSPPAGGMQLWTDSVISMKCMKKKLNCDFMFSESIKRRGNLNNLYNLPIVTTTWCFPLFHIVTWISFLLKLVGWNETFCLFWFNQLSLLNIILQFRPHK